MQTWMTYSLSGLHLTEGFEGCKLVGYADELAHGLPTAGYGHTGPDVVVGQTYTQAQAEAWLQEDIQFASTFVNRAVTVQLTQGEFDALVDFAFNLGVGNEQHSTLLALVNKGDFANAANEFQKWDRAGGVVVAGLLRRRLAEKAEFQS